MCAEDALTGPQECFEEEVSSSFEDNDIDHVKYLRNMVGHYIKHMVWYELGFVPAHDFMPETVDDIYSNHLYCVSWFYVGVFPFDSWEVEYDDYLREQVQNALNCAGTS